MSLLLYFRKDMYSLVKEVARDSKQGRLARLLLIATVPAALAGLLFSGFIEDSLRSTAVVAVSLFVVGVLMLIADTVAKDQDSEQVTNKQGLQVGFAQVLALVPGVSRSGITMTAGLFSGMSRVQAARFSFLLAIPIIAGSAFGVLVDGDLSDTSQSILLVGVVAAFVSGLAAIKFMLHIIARVGLKPFAYYRILLAIGILLFV
jgi:undecaprenyl-diphosphatase